MPERPIRNTPIPERAECIDFWEQTEVLWRQFFKEFDEKVLPMFREHGFNRQNAYATWQRAELTTAVNTLIARLEEQQEDDYDGT